MAVVVTGGRQGDLLVRLCRASAWRIISRVGGILDDDWERKGIPSLHVMRAW
jgi:hypothetical protein